MALMGLLGLAKKKKKKIPMGGLLRVAKKKDIPMGGLLGAAGKFLKKKRGGTLKSVPADNKGLAKLPTEVRNNMGYAKAGGHVKMQNGGKTSVAMKKKSKKCPINGVAKRGQTRGVTVVA